MPESQLKIGPINAADNTLATQRGGKQGDAIVSELHGRFYEASSRSNVFMGGMGLTSISNATFTTATVDATATPIVGLYNPSGSNVNAILLQAQLAVTMTALQATGCGGFVWMASNAAGPISTGSTPFRSFGLAQAGSGCKFFAGPALTGKTGTLAVLRGSALGGGSALALAFLATQASMQTTHFSSVENFDGQIILPPNSVIGLFATTTPVGHSAVSGLTWEEVPV